MPLLPSEFAPWRGAALLRKKKKGLETAPIRPRPVVYCATEPRFYAAGNPAAAVVVEKTSRNRVAPGLRQRCPGRGL